MTADRRPLGPLGRRLLAAFLLVALSSVVALTVAALIGTGQGLLNAQRTDRERSAAAVAAVVAHAYRDGGGWEHADLTSAASAAAGVGARLVVLDSAGAVVATSGSIAQNGGAGGPGEGHGPGGQGDLGPAGNGVRSPVVVDGRQVGTAELRFPGAGASSAQEIAWWWIAVAAAVALVIALAASWFVTRRLTGPLVRLARTARAFAAGDRGARAGVTAPGELGELGRAFDGMADEVARSEEARRLLAADIAHELRTPLASLQAGLEELRDGLEPASPARLASLHDQALRLGRVVEDLGELSAAESAAMSLRMSEVDLAELARAALAARESQLRAAGLRIQARTQDRVPVLADPDRIHQAVGNLLANAARYCRPGDEVLVRVEADGECAVVEVSDTGPGIPQEDLPHVFDRLWRGRGAREVAGRGIGLAVVREIAAAHNGVAAATSGPDGGATFTIRLPLATRRPVSRPARPLADPGPSPGPPR